MEKELGKCAGQGSELSSSCVPKPLSPGGLCQHMKQSQALLHQPSCPSVCSEGSAEHAEQSWLQERLPVPPTVLSREADVLLRAGGVLL